MIFFYFKCFLVEKGISDNSTVANFSIMFYYTVEYANKVPLHQMEQEAQDTIDILNEGFENSKIPIKAFKFCSVMPAYIHDKGLVC